jgi:hypothetical protein
MAPKWNKQLNRVISMFPTALCCRLCPLRQVPKAEPLDIRIKVTLFLTETALMVRLSVLFDQCAVFPTCVKFLACREKHYIEATLPSRVHLHFFQLYLRNVIHNIRQRSNLFLL